MPTFCLPRCAGEPNQWVLERRHHLYPHCCGPEPKPSSFLARVGLGELDVLAGQEMGRCETNCQNGADLCCALMKGACCIAPSLFDLLLPTLGRMHLPCKASGLCAEYEWEACTSLTHALLAAKQWMMLVSLSTVWLHTAALRAQLLDSLIWHRPLWQMVSSHLHSAQAGEFQRTHTLHHLLSANISFSSSCVCVCACLVFLFRLQRTLVRSVIQTWGVTGCLDLTSVSSIPQNGQNHWFSTDTQLLTTGSKTFSQPHPGNHFCWWAKCCEGVIWREGSGTVERNQDARMWPHSLCEDVGHVISCTPNSNRLNSIQISTRPHSFRPCHFSMWSYMLELALRTNITQTLSINGVTSEGRYSFCMWLPLLGGHSAEEHGVYRAANHYALVVIYFPQVHYH